MEKNFTIWIKVVLTTRSKNRTVCLGENTRFDLSNNGKNGKNGLEILIDRINFSNRFFCLAWRNISSREFSIGRMKHIEYDFFRIKSYFLPKNGLERFQIFLGIFPIAGFSGHVYFCGQKTVIFICTSWKYPSPEP
jgi:hypothetical protein